MRAIPVSPAGVAVLLLAGCATSADPAQGGFISGVNGLLSHGYDQRIHAQTEDLNQLRMQQAAAENEARLASSTLADRERRLHDLRDQVGVLDRTLKAAQAAAAQQRARNNTLTESDRRLMTDLDAATARLGRLQEQLRSGTAGADYDTEKQRYLSLRAAIEALGEQLREAQRQ